jgi:UDP-N-acetyl-2-amino-2-deoxyglucuronate dehydrogenase
MTAPLRIAIAGAGQMGVAHADAFRACGTRIVAIVDVHEARASRLASDHGAKAFTTVDAALAEGVDALSICLPHSLHFAAAMAAAEHGVALLIEKPHCVTLEHSRILRQACAQRGIAAMAGFTHRFLASSVALKAKLDAGALGRVDLAIDRLIAGAIMPPAPSWYRQRDLAGGGVAMIGMIHSIDRLRWLLGSEILSVMARVKQTDPTGDVEDTAVALLDFANGTEAALVSHRSPVPGHERSHHYELFGERMNAYCTISSFGNQELRLVGPHPGQSATVTDDRPFEAEVREFISALREGRPPSPGLADAEIALGVVLAIYESARCGHPVRLSEFYGERP